MTTTQTKSKTESSAKSSGKAKVKAIPEGMNSVSPYLTCSDAAAAIDFYKQAFKAKETGRVAGPDGKIVNAALQIFGSSVMVMDEMMDAKSPKSLGGSPVTIHLYVEDVDAVVERAVKAGARLHMPVSDQFWGDRYGQIEDPSGHHWSIATHQRDPSPEEMKDALSNMEQR